MKAWRLLSILLTLVGIVLFLPGTAQADGGCTASAPKPYRNDSSHQTIGKGAYTCSGLIYNARAKVTLYYQHAGRLLLLGISELL